MKSPTVFLMALAVSTTLFLESSTAAVDSTASEDTGIVNAGASIGNEKDLIVIEAIAKLKDRFETIINNIGQAIKSINNKDRINVDESDKQRLNKAMENARNAITRAIIITENAVPKGPKAKDADKNNQVNAWLKNLLVITISIHNDINVAIDAGWVKPIERVTVKTVQAIAEAKAEWAGLEKTLAKGKVRDDVSREMKINFGNADLIVGILKVLLSSNTAA
ncbi:uncharacterized protein [Maniola hyperantus]|uniref:uncharacterized protein n=1 Tax=Aphantopus hyperantus TaxID=2795564 RepID=UPI0021342FE9